jgi:hypothetical protein
MRWYWAQVLDSHERSAHVIKRSPARTAYWEAYQDLEAFALEGYAHLEVRSDPVERDGYDFNQLEWPMRSESEATS